MNQAAISQFWVFIFCSKKCAKIWFKRDRQIAIIIKFSNNKDKWLSSQLWSASLQLQWRWRTNSHSPRTPSQLIVGISMQIARRTWIWVNHLTGISVQQKSSTAVTAIAEPLYERKMVSGKANARSQLISARARTVRRWQRMVRLSAPSTLIQRLLAKAHALGLVAHARPEPESYRPGPRPRHSLAWSSKTDRQTDRLTDRRLFLMCEIAA